jgi:hypothetical protein
VLANTVLTNTVLTNTVLTNTVLAKAPPTAPRPRASSEHGGTAMDVTSLRKAHDDFLAVAAEGGFGPPPAGEWDADRILAHVALGEMSGAAAALAIAAGQRAVYDNRSSLDEWNLQRAVAGTSGAGGPAGLVRRYGDLLCDIAASLTERELDVSLPVLIISKDQVLVDAPRPLRSLLVGFGQVHLPGHAEQLRGLQR